MKSVKSKDKVWVQWKGKIYGLSLDSGKRRSGSGPEAKELVAPFSCKILKIFVKSGQSVSKGEPVVVVEAMKMEYSYTSPRDGVIESVPIKEGEIVTGGTQFVRWRSS